MHLRFQPSIAELGRVEFRPYMLEVAWDYCQTVLQSAHRRGMVEQTIGALAVEVLLKSFNSAVCSNAGTVAETYKFDSSRMPARTDKHNLASLADILPPELRRYLLDAIDEQTITEHQSTFKTSRYHYEPDAPLSSSDAPIRLALSMLCKTVYLYKRLGCTDPFVVRFDVNAVYFKHVQPFAIPGGCGVPNPP